MRLQILHDPTIHSALFMQIVLTLQNLVLTLKSVQILVCGSPIKILENVHCHRAGILTGRDCQCRFNSAAYLWVADPGTPLLFPVASVAFPLPRNPS